MKQVGASGTCETTRGMGLTRHMRMNEMNKTGDLGAGGTCETTRRIGPVREGSCETIRQARQETIRLVRQETIRQVGQASYGSCETAR